MPIENLPLNHSLDQKIKIFQRRRGNFQGYSNKNAIISIHLIQSTNNVRSHSQRIYIFREGRRNAKESRLTKTKFERHTAHGEGFLQRRA